MWNKRMPRESCVVVIRECSRKGIVKESVAVYDENENVSDYDFGRFLIAFNDMKEIEKNDTTWIELDQDKHTKDMTQVSSF